MAKLHESQRKRDPFTTTVMTQGLVCRGKSPSLHPDQQDRILNPGCPSDSRWVLQECLKAS